MWHLTCDTWWGVNILSKLQLLTYYSLELTVCWKFWTKGWLNQLINNLGVCRTAPATLGLVTGLVAGIYFKKGFWNVVKDRKHLVSRHNESNIQTWNIKLWDFDSWKIRYEEQHIYMSQAKYHIMVKYTLLKYYLAKYTVTWVLVKVKTASEAKYTLPSIKIIKYIDRSLFPLYIKRS